MGSWSLVLLILFVLGIIISNIMLLKHSAKMKLPAEVSKAIQKKNKTQDEKQE